MSCVIKYFVQVGYILLAWLAYNRIIKVFSTKRLHSFVNIYKKEENHNKICTKPFSNSISIFSTVILDNRYKVMNAHVHRAPGLCVDVGFIF